MRVGGCGFVCKRLGTTTLLIHAFVETPRLVLICSLLLKDLHILFLRFPDFAVIRIVQLLYS